jgi:tellurite methyltransferase
MPRRHQREQPPWLEYYKATSQGPPWDTLTKALSMSDAETSGSEGRFAVDLGCGAGRDTFELLQRGWKVLAVDNEPQAIRWIRSAMLPEHRPRLSTRLVSFEHLKLPKCDLVNASYSLPFCQPKRFDAFWRKVTSSLHSGGRFAGHFFGEHDEWAGDSDLTCHTASQVKALLRQALRTEFFLEKEWDGTTASGHKKHWHVFSVVARKL